MSSSLSAHVVDWAQLVVHCDKRKDQGTWLLEAAENAEPWVEPWWTLPLRHRWCPNSRVWADARRAYDDLRENLDETTRQSFDGFFEVFFLGSQGSHIRVVDLAIGDLDQAVFAITMSPSTVERYAQLIGSLPFESLRGAYRQGFEFDYLPDYLQQWDDLFRLAADRAKGLIILLIFRSLKPS
jgi:hypothetical protein